MAHLALPSMPAPTSAVGAGAPGAPGGEWFIIAAAAVAAIGAHVTNKSKQRFAERMSNTAHQREVRDLRAAGLNPILSANRGASTPDPQLINPAKDAVDAGKAFSALRLAKQSVEAEIHLKDHMGEKAQAEAELARESSTAVRAGGVIRTLQEQEARLKNLLYGMGVKAVEAIIKDPAVQGMLKMLANPSGSVRLPFGAKDLGASLMGRGPRIRQAIVDALNKMGFATGDEMKRKKQGRKE